MLLTTHHIDEAESISDYVYIISNGSIQAHGSPSGLKSQLGIGDRIILSQEKNNELENESEKAHENPLLEDSLVSEFVQKLQEEFNTEAIQISQATEGKEY